MEQKWWHKSVVYQIYPRSFMDSNGDGIGDIQGIISKLDYLEKLGIDVIWLSPVYQSPMDDNGYDISDYQDIAKEFGTMADMDELLEEAGTRGIKIIMDLVVNHSSDEHKWFLEAKKSVDNHYRDYYIWREGKRDEDGNRIPPKDLGSAFGGSTWEYDETTDMYYFHIFSKKQPDLNWENETLRQEIYDMMNWWLEKGIGGFRMDVIDLIGKEVDKGIKENGPRLHDLIKEMHESSFGNYDVLTVGETWGASPASATRYSDPDRKELSMIFQFEHMVLDWHSVHGKWKPVGLDFIRLKRVMSKWQTDLTKGWNSLFWNNHDLPRIVSRWGNDGDHRETSAKMFAILLHMMKGTPYIYQGEEIGMTNVKFSRLEDYNDIEIHGTYKDKVLRDEELTHEEFMRGVYQNGRDNARTPMQWNNQEHAGFTTGNPWLQVNENYEQINVKEALCDKRSIFYTYQKLIELRKNSKYSDTIIYGDYTLLYRNHPEVFAYTRADENYKLLVVANFTDTFSEIVIPDEFINGSEIVISTDKELSVRESIRLDPYESFVLGLEIT
ncbi:glycoside hydrolase family 13 protein [Haloplasma contractile]|uniref:Trehalose-6-P hydrolase protein n=1 Tax=Haloplasma contractile SSD-17B TaxID=1033810 RepID=U2FF61_9MOLU|nr:alpha-glucosidase [Haloplasma contractile]ERJ11550.1 Trehalose-6-P hydrolase protein [Haloplasma contractile SSD-17B]